MKEIVIISYFYAPANMMGAIRMSKLSKYFTCFGYKVTVITSKNSSLLFMKEKEREDPILSDDVKKVEVLRVSHSYLYNLLARKIRMKFFTNNKKSPEFVQQKGGKVKKWLMHYGVYFLSLIQDFDFCLKSKKIIDTIEFNEDTILISTYGPLASHMLGSKIKRKKKLKWIADFRDPIAQPENYKLEFAINKFLEKRIYKKSTKVVAVSEGYLNTINMHNNDKGIVITNGYDKSDSNYITKEYKTNKLTFAYTGTLYSGKRDITPLFRAIKELSTKKVINLDNIMFYYAGVQENYFYNMAKKFGLEKQVFSIGSVSRLESLKLQASSDILVAATWNNIKDSGILPGKFLEYMLLKKPVLALVSGKEKNSEIKRLIDDIQLGFCFEQGNSMEDYLLLKKFITKKYQEYNNKGRVDFTADQNKLDKYSYKNIARKYAELIESI